MLTTALAAATYSNSSCLSATGAQAYLTNLEVYCDNTFVTNVQGDGLLLATPTGSTAYSLAGVLFYLP